MSTIDMTQVAGLQAVDAEGNVIGTLSVDDLTDLVANNLVKSTQNQIAAARSVSTMSEASTLAASDDYENTLPIDANPASVRTLDAAGNPKQTGISALAQVVGGLLKSQKFATSIGALWNYGNAKDANECLVTGLYVTTSSTSNVATLEDTCLMIVMADNLYAVQLCFSLNLLRVYYRRILKYSSNFGSWQEFQKK